jgi:hypothetical protein
LRLNLPKHTPSEISFFLLMDTARFISSSL